MLYLSREDGQGMAEYAFILVLVAFILMGILTVLGSRIIAKYEWIVDQLSVIFI